jgi:hypothetical protein
MHVLCFLWSQAIYVFWYSKLVHLWHVYVLLLALCQNPLIINFSGSFWTIRNCQGSLNRTCLAPGPDMTGYQASGYIKGVCTPSNPKPTKSSPLLSCGGQGSPKAILDLLHRIPSVSRRFGSPTPCDLQILVGFLSPKVYSRFLHSSSISYNALFHMPWSTSRISLPCFEILSGMNFHILQVEDKVFIS